MSLNIKQFDFLHDGQIRGQDFCHNAGWYDKHGNKFGWGDLSLKDFREIQKKLPENEVFIILGERDSFWNFVTAVNGPIGRMAEVSDEEKNPGLDYVCNKFRYLIDKNEIYCSGEGFTRDGIEFKSLENIEEVLKGLG